MAAGCQTSKCRARCRLIARKLPRSRDESSKRALSVYSAGRDTGCGRPFNSVFDLDFPRKKGVKGHEGHCFVLLALLHLDDHSKRSGHTQRFEVIFLQLVAVFRKISRFSCCYLQYSSIIVV